MEGIIDSGRPSIESVLTMVVLSSIAVILRFLAKSGTKAGFAIDDYWIIAGLMTFWTYTGVMLWSIFDGGGGPDMDNFTQLNLTGIALYLKGLVINTCLWATSTTCVKLSILFFYRRIFAVHRLFRIATVVLGILCVCWWVTLNLGITLYCIPLESFWNPQVQGHCMNFGVYFLVVSIVDLIIDVSLLCLPLWLIPTLQLQTKDKVNLAAIFLLGGFVCITAVVRMVKVYVPGSAQINYAKGIVWSNIHLGTGIICACLPTYRPLVAKWPISLSNFRKRYGSLSTSARRLNGSSTNNSAQAMHSSKRSRYEQFDAHGGDQLQLVEVTGGAASENWSRAGKGNLYDVQRTTSVV